MMNLYQPVLFIGLGGTGCDIGAVVERRLREELCGADGTQFRNLRKNSELLPYQLPSCVQFLYADLNQADLNKMPRRVVPGSQHVPAAQATAHYVRDLTPAVASYPQLAVKLRLAAERETASWLPSDKGEPRISPLTKGAGQLPTIGRAALFGTFLGSVDPAMRDLRNAIGNLATSAEDLVALGGRAPRAVDVFVAFSLAGGTGAGIFYDYLHLVGDLCGSRLPAKIYPLVLMPSAFPLGLGGGRPAQLNAARSLLDLFRLVDQQNAGDAVRDLTADDRREPGSEWQSVRYPGMPEITLPAGMVQTAFLFSQPVGADRVDLHRSIASLVLSLIGTELHPDDDKTGESHQTFADWWVNSGSNRQTPADNGIGNRGVSTALVASLTVPIDDLAGLIAGRLLRTAIEQLATPVGKPESNNSYIEDFMRAASVHPILARDGVQFAEPEPGHGAREVATALNDRAEAMKAGLVSLQAKLDRDMPRLVGGFDPRAAISELLGMLDVFRTQRVAFGHNDLADSADKVGAAGVLNRRLASPVAPDGFGPVPPTAEEYRNRLAGIIKVKWSDREPVAVRQQQDIWYLWRTHVAWAEAWAAHAPQWRRTLAEAEAELRRLTDGLLEFARQDDERYGSRAAELYRRRVGVSYLLPPGGAGMEQFYQLTTRRLIEEQVNDGKLQPAATESDLVRALIGTDVWRSAYQTTSEQGAAQAVDDLRDYIKRRVKVFLQESAGGQRPLLPRLHDLLAAAAGQHLTMDLGQDYVDEFRGKLAGLVPATFTPQGSGQMKVLVSYPADAQSRSIEAYLRESINLPPEPEMVYDMKNTNTESISVVLFRSSMGVTEVNEVRDVLRLWAAALSRPERSDFLRWRQRTGYQFAYLATTEEHRVEILHRVLSAMWNGRVRAEGPAESPEQVRVEFGGGVTMILQLTPLEGTSSWASLLRAYELWTLNEEDIHRQFCAQLMRELPDGLEGSYRNPDPLFTTVCGLAEKEIQQLDELIEQLPVSSRGRAQQMRQFWADTLPAALEREFAGLESPARANLRLLQAAAQQRGLR
jgi:hypothetical protein